MKNPMKLLQEVARDPDLAFMLASQRVRRGVRAFQKFSLREWLFELFGSKHKKEA